MTFDLKEISRELNDFVFTAQIPSTGELIKGRPYTIRDEFKLAQIQRATVRGHTMEMLLEMIKTKYFSLTQKQIEALTTVDVQHLLGQLKLQSEDSNVPLVITCVKCGHEFKHSFNIKNIELPPDSKFTADIEITSKSKLKSKLTLTLKRISFMTLIKNYTDEEEQVQDMNDEQVKQYLVESIYSIAYGDEVKKDIPLEDMVEFVEDIPKENFPKLKEFLANPPTLVYNSKLVCPECGFENSLSVDDFFFLFF